MLGGSGRCQSSAGDRDQQPWEQPLYAEVPRSRVAQSLGRTSITIFQRAVRFLLLKPPTPGTMARQPSPLPCQRSQGASMRMDKNKE